MTGALHKIMPSRVPDTRRQRGALLESLARVSPVRLARRVLTAGDAERQRIERDLHDGVQQRLTGLRFRLAVAADDFEQRGDADASVALNGFGAEVEQAIEEVRAFARGVYPALLASNGLGSALLSASRYAAGPVIVSARGLHRYRPEVENAVYFTCLAGIDNAAKHAGPAEVSVRVWETDEELHFSVCDTGCGFDPSHTPAGGGLTNMRDRVSALGGRLDMDSTPSNGTWIHGSVPDPWPGAAAERDRPLPELQARAPGWDSSTTEVDRVDQVARGLIKR